MALLVVVVVVAVAVHVVGPPTALAGRHCWTDGWRRCGAPCVCLSCCSIYSSLRVYGVNWSKSLRRHKNVGWKESSIVRRESLTENRSFPQLHSVTNQLIFSQSNEREIAVYLYCSTAVHTSRKQSILRSVDRLPAPPFSLQRGQTAHNYVTSQPKILYSSPVAPIETPPRASPNFVVQCPRSHITKTHNPIHHHHGFTRSIVLCVPFAPSQRDASNMKFCKNLQRVVDISDPEWAPYWTNYKMLKVGFIIA